MDDPASTFECGLDGAEFAPCQSPTEHTDLSDGEHIFRVRATGSSRHHGEAASRSWTVDTAGPEARIDAGPEGSVATTEAMFEFSADESASYECKLAGDGPFDACTSPTTYGGLADGEHTFRVRALDDARQRRSGCGADLEGGHGRADDGNRREAGQAHIRRARRLHLQRR